MRMLIVFLVSLCMHNDIGFYEKVLNDFRDNSYFVLINVKSKDYNGKAVIENDDLYYYFNKTQKLNKNQYKDSIIKQLEYNSSISIGNADFIRWNFIKIPLINSVNLNAKKGLEKFIKIYFNGNVLKDGITDEERVVIIQKLFEWKISTNIDCETGFLLISR